MAKTSKTVISLDEQEAMVTECLKHRAEMDDWERGFVESLRDYRGGGGFLSDLQIEKLKMVMGAYCE